MEKQFENLLKQIKRNNYFIKQSYFIKQLYFNYIIVF